MYKKEIPFLTSVKLEGLEEDGHCFQPRLQVYGEILINAFNVHASRTRRNMTSPFFSVAG